MGYIENTIERRAAKRHECEGDGSSDPRHADDCPRVIEPGEDYIEYLGETPAYQSGSRHSIPCAVEFFTEREAGGELPLGEHRDRTNEPTTYARLSRVEAEQIARFVAENHDRIREGMLIERFSDGRLRLRRIGEGAALARSLGNVSEAAEILGEKEER